MSSTIVFDGLDWQSVAAAAYYQSGRTYSQGRGAGLAFLDYRGVETDFGFCVTSPASNSEGVEVDAQTVADTSGGLGGGYDSELGGATPWATPPCTWPASRIGLTIVPASSQAMCRRWRTCPVSVSTSTTATCEPNG